MVERVVTCELATKEQNCDMLTFYQTGEQSFLNCTIFHSVPRVPLRQQKLTNKARQKTRCTPKETEAKQVNKYLRSSIAWLSSNKHLDGIQEEQYSELP